MNPSSTNEEVDQAQAGIDAIVAENGVSDETRAGLRVGHKNYTFAEIRLLLPPVIKNMLEGNNFWSDPSLTPPPLVDDAPTNKEAVALPFPESAPTPPQPSQFTADSPSGCLTTATEPERTTLPKRRRLLGGPLWDVELGRISVPRGVGETWISMATSRANSQGQAPLKEQRPPENSPSVKAAKPAKGVPEQTFAASAGFADGSTDAFPVDLLPDAIREIVGEPVRLFGVPDSLAAVAALAVVSASLGAGVEAGSGNGRTIRGNIYALAFAESGTGKSEAWKIVGQPFEDEERRRLRDWQDKESPRLRAKLEFLQAEYARLLKSDGTDDESSHEERCAELLVQIEAAKRALETPPRLNVGDATGAALVRELARAPGNAIATFAPEARGAVKVLAGRYNADGLGDEHVYLSAYSGEGMTVIRASKEAISPEKPCLTLCWFLQPDQWRRLSEKADMLDSGLLARCLIFDSKAQAKILPDVPLSPDEQIRTRWGKLVVSLLQTYRDSPSPVRVVELEPGAAKALHSFDNEMRLARNTGGALSDVIPFASRMAENARRLALVLHAAIHGTRCTSALLSEDTARRAIGLVRWFSRQTLLLLGAYRRRKERKRVDEIAAILRTKGGECTLRVLRDNHGVDDAEVCGLAAHQPHVLKIEKRMTRGRPSEVAILLRDPTAK